MVVLFLIFYLSILESKGYSALSSIDYKLNSSFLADNEFLQSLTSFDIATIDLMWNQLNFSHLNDEHEHLKNKTLILKRISIFQLAYSQSIFNYFGNIYIQDSNMEFHMNNKNLSERNNCLELIKKYGKNSEISGDKTNHFVRLSNVIYPQKSCPIFYYKSFITSVSFENISQIPSYFDFPLVEYLEYISYDSINKIEFRNFNKHIEKSLFNFLINGLTFEVSFLESSLNKIEDNTFSNFFQMRRLLFQLHNMRQFLQTTDNTWMQSLNQYNKIYNLKDCDSLKKSKLKNTIYWKMYLILEDISQNYDYPEKDFCKFISFPHQNFVFPIIHSKPGMECTCTLVWLLMNYKLESYFDDQFEPISMKTNSVQNCFENIEQKIAECNFSQKLSECGKKLDMSEYLFNCDKSEKSKCPLKFVEIILMFIVLCAGLPIHISSIYALVKSNLNEKMYHYLKIQIFFEIISTFTLIFNLSTSFSYDLLTFSEDISCESDFRSKNKYFFLIKYEFINLISYVSITCAALANFLVVLDRYLFITSKKIFKKIDLISKVYSVMLPCVVLFGIFLNAYQIDFISVQSNNFSWYYSLRVKLNLTQDVFYIIICIIIFIINLKLIIFIYRQNSKKKILIKFKLNTKSSDKSITKNVCLIILNSVLMVLMRVPCFFISFIEIYKFKLEAGYILALPFEKDLGHVFWFYLILINLSFIIQFFINYLFNKKFQKVYCIYIFGKKNLKNT